MKKIFLPVIAIIISATGFAQFSLGVQATGSLSNAKIKSQDDFSYNKKKRAMPGGGIVVQYNFSEKIAVRTGVNYLQHGVWLRTTVDEETNMKIKIENRLNYLQLPVSVLYNIPLQHIQLYAGAGGFFNYGISGKAKATLSYTMSDGSESTTVEEVKAFKKEEDGGLGFKKTDFGISALAGARFRNGLFANIGYQYSLSNIDEAENDVYKNRGLQLTVGYFF